MGESERQREEAEREGIEFLCEREDRKKAREGEGEDV